VARLNELHALQKDDSRREYQLKQDLSKRSRESLTVDPFFFFFPFFPNHECHYIDSRYHVMHCLRPKLHIGKVFSHWSRWRSQQISGVKFENRLNRYLNIER